MSSGENKEDFEEYENERFVFRFVLELSSDVIVYKRSIYSSFDWLGDVGGLHDGLRHFGYLFL